MPDRYRSSKYKLRPVNLLLISSLIPGNVKIDHQMSSQHVYACVVYLSTVVTSSLEERRNKECCLIHVRRRTPYLRSHHHNLPSYHSPPFSDAAAGLGFIEPDPTQDVILSDETVKTRVR